MVLVSSLLAMVPVVVSAQAAPLTVPLTERGGAWTVEAKVAGRIGTFLLGLGSPTGVLDEWLEGDHEESDPEVSLGGRLLGEVGTFRLKRRMEYGGRRIVGTLGADLLGRYALGFDLAGGTLTLWPRLSEGEALRWVGEGARRTPLVRRDDRAPVVAGTLRGQPVALALRAVGDGLAVRAAANLVVESDPSLTETEAIGEGGVPFRTRNRITEGLRVDGRTLPWVRYVPVPTAKHDGLPQGVDGSLFLGAGVRGRVVLDLPGAALVGRPESEDEAIGRELSVLLQVPVRVEGDTIRLGRVEPQGPLAPLTKYEGHRVVRFGDRYDVQMLPAFRGTDRSEALGWLAGVVKAPFKLRILEEEGGDTVIPVEIDPTGGAAKP